MRKRLFCAGILCLALLSLTACDVTELSTLPELSRPYAGVYSCKVLTLGGTDCLPRFQEVTLELDYGGEFTLAYRREGGGAGEQKGTYEVSPACDEITFGVRAGTRTIRRTFPVRDGAIEITLTFGGRLLHAVFCR